VKNLRGTFTANAAGDDIYGLYSTATANVRVANVRSFSIASNTQPVEQENGATGTLVTSNSSVLRITNAVGQFITNTQVYDTSTNSYANVTAVYYANNLKTQSFSRFKQTLRVSLSTHTGTFANNELIEQDTTGATAVILSSVDDVDMFLADVSGSFTNNELVIQTSSGANGIVLAANSTYLRLTAVQGTFADAAIAGQTSGATANVTCTPVLICTDVNGTWSQATNNQITGLTSGAIGFSTLANTISFPDMVRDIGDVLYIENMSPFTRTSYTQETVKIVIKF
jgi:hypothetical protein